MKLTRRTLNHKLGHTISNHQLDYSAILQPDIALEPDPRQPLPWASLLHLRQQVRCPAYNFRMLHFYRVELSCVAFLSEDVVHFIFIYWI